MKAIDSYIQGCGGETRERPLGSPGSIWEDNIKIDLQDVGWGGLDSNCSGSG